MYSSAQIIFTDLLQPTKNNLLDDLFIKMSTIPVPPTPPKEDRVPELSALDINKLITEYVAQIKYYENIQPWKVYMRREL